MPLAAGQTLSFYEILGPLGAGGMGEVYRARDTRLDREVAIKVLPEELADDEERLRRFEREAKTLASLNHPNVAGIHGVDQEGDVYFLALELVPGEDLAVRLSQGPLGLEDSIDVCRQIAEGLEAAHEAGVVHRDLKPANVRITPEGVVKILDFGLAKPIRPKASSAESDSFAMTQDGMVLGTPTYMSPEQARGKPVDRRTDIWAFGCVLFECLTGERAFGGHAVAEILAAVLERSWDASALPAGTPPHVRVLIDRCLDKDPRTRLRDIGEARLDLTGTREAESVVPTPSATGAGTRFAPAWIAAALVAGGLLGFGLRRTPEPERPPVTRLALPQAPGLIWNGMRKWVSSLAISPDGEYVVYCSEIDRGLLGQDEVLVLWKRSEPEAKILVRSGAMSGGTGGLSMPFFSPEGDWVAYQVKLGDDAFELRKIPTVGGDSELIGSMPWPMVGASWGPGTILCGVISGGIFRIPDTGGKPERVTKTEPGVEWTHHSPVLLPGGEQMLFVIDYEGMRSDVVLRSLTSGQQEVLIPGATSVHLLQPGYAVYTKGQSLWADTFDLETHQLGRDPVQLRERIGMQLLAPQVKLAQDGTLLYVEPQEVPRGRTLTWVDREGGEEPTGFPPQPYTFVALSPSGSKAALGIAGELRVGDLVHKSVSEPLATERASRPVWTQDDEHLVWYDGSNGTLIRQAASGAGLPERGGLFEAAPNCLTGDGDMVLHSRFNGSTGQDLFLTPFHGNAEEDGVPFLVERGNQGHAAFSRDGTWLAYATYNSTGSEVFVSPVPVLGPRTQVSFGGGSFPRWSQDGSELFFATPDRELMVVSVTTTGEAVQFGEPTRIHDELIPGTELYGFRPFDVMPDGQRFLVIQEDPNAPPPRPEIRVVVNWIEELRARLEDRD